ncbi:SDR family NAD(P)-dependent oxidoreductase [Salibacterium aidingense]|uniref:SDR family NAD(P)-dependent oxidoreductase n=1 Tax=Salibacterium aidingense TaxID=384933 RepID=UPI003BCB4F0E
MNEVNDKRIFIVGGGSGIGLATVEHFLAVEAKVAVMDINQQSLKKLAERVNKPDFLLTMEGDVRKKEQVEFAFSQMTKKWGGVDTLIYSAGVFPDAPILEMEETQWDHVLDINLKGAFLVCQKAAARMIEQGTAGQIITISSGSYQSARIGSGHYCASKAGVVMLTKVLALELAEHHIQVNSIAPGLVKSERLEEDYITTFSRRIPFGRPAEPWEISKMIEMMISTGNSYMTGQVLSVDGGLSAGHFGLPLSNKSEKL